MMNSRVSASICIALALSTFAASAATITSVTPSSGPSTGGTLVIVTGEGFLDCQIQCAPVGQVVFDDGQSVQVTLSSMQVQFITPPHAPGTAQFTINGGFGGTSPRPVGTFTFLDANAQTIPTLSEWVLLALMGLLGVIGFIRVGN